MPTATDLFLEFSRRKLLDRYWPRLKACVGSLSGEDLRFYRELDKTGRAS